MRRVDVEIIWMLALYVGHKVIVPIFNDIGFPFYSTFTLPDVLRRSNLAVEESTYCIGRRENGWSSDLAAHVMSRSDHEPHDRYPSYSQNLLTTSPAATPIAPYCISCPPWPILGSRLEATERKAQSGTLISSNEICTTTRCKFTLPETIFLNV